MAVLVCCVSVGSRKVRLGKFGQGGSGKEGHGKARRGVSWRLRRGMLMARCGTASLVRARRGMAVEASSDMVCQGGAGFGWAVLAR